MLGLFKRNKKRKNQETTEEPGSAQDAVVEQPAAPEKPEPEPKSEPEPKPEEPEPKLKKESGPASTEEAKAEAALPDEPLPETQKQPEPEKKKSLFARLKSGLAKTRSGLTDGLASLFGRGRKLDDELLEELETRLLMADVGMTATQEIIANLTDKVDRKQLKDAPALFEALKVELKQLLEPVCKPLILPEKSTKPFVILMVGVNGVGKTTTIGKLARRYQGEGKKLLLAAGDTFRAAAVEQLSIWGERNQVPVIAQHTGADSASVVFDALQAAQSRQADVLIADTAGRLHNKSHLMEELAKIRRVMRKLDAEAPHETLLVLDAGTGQNAVAQARQFHESVPLTGLVLTKLDGTAKGGVVFALARELGIPVRYIGVGEQVDDLRTFDAETFVDALLDIQLDSHPS